MHKMRKSILMEMKYEMLLKRRGAGCSASLYRLSDEGILEQKTTGFVVTTIFPDREASNYFEVAELIEAAEHYSRACLRISEMEMNALEQAGEAANVEPE